MWQVESYELAMQRRDVGPNITEITSADTCDRWLVIRRMLDATNISVQVSMSATNVDAHLLLLVT